jgi:hypothetical protein
MQIDVCRLAPTGVAPNQPIRHPMLEDLSPKDSPAMHRFWDDYRQRLLGLKHAACLHVTLPPPCRPPEISPCAARKTGNWGSLAMYIVIRVKRALCRDAHDRAARREEAWYNF